MQNTGRKYKLSEIVMMKNNVKQEIKDNYQKIKLLSAHNKKSDDDLRRLVIKQKDLRDTLSKYKVLINDYNQKIYAQIVTLAELKMYLTELRLTKFCGSNYEIKLTMSQIKTIEESLSEYNDLTTINWWQLIGLNK